jgi:hypothetical protein
MAHSFVTAFKDEPLNRAELIQKDGNEKFNLQKLSKQYLEEFFEMVCSRTYLEII